MRHRGTRNAEKGVDQTKRKKDMISLTFWFLVGAAIAVYLVWMSGMLCEIVSGVGELIFGDNGAYVIWIIIILGGAAWLFL